MTIINQFSFKLTHITTNLTLFQKCLRLKNHSIEVPILYLILYMLLEREKKVLVRLWVWKPKRSSKTTTFQIIKYNVNWELGRKIFLSQTLHTSRLTIASRTPIHSYMKKNFFQTLAVDWIKSLVCCMKYNTSRKEDVNNGKAIKAINPSLLVYLCSNSIYSNYTTDFFITQVVYFLKIRIKVF